MTVERNGLKDSGLPVEHICDAFYLVVFHAAFTVIWV